MPENPFQFRIGDFACVSINDQTRLASVEMLFPHRSAEECQQVLGDYVTDGLPGAINILYIDTGVRRILVDSSIGGANSHLVETLAGLGIPAEAITHVIVTHGHGDHVGGLVDSGRLVFPNARCAIHRTEWDYWTDEANLQALGDDPRAVLWRGLKAHLAGRVDFFSLGDEILPGMWAVDAKGHTVGQVAVLIESAGEKLLHIADVAHHPFQLHHPDWSPRFDSQPEVAAQTRQALFERVEGEGLLTLGYHFPSPGLGYVRAGQWEPLA